MTGAMTGAMIGPTMTEAELLGRLRLARTDGVGPATYRRLLQRFATAAEALEALPGLASAGGRAAAPAIPALGAIRREMDSVAKLGGRILVLGGPDYPPLLALMDSAPPAMAVLGDVAALDARAVAMVGARNASANGQRVAEILAADLAAAGDGEKGLFDQAVALVSREGKASTSFIQRHLGIGYNRAAKLIEQMEKEGVVSPANHVGKRDVLTRSTRDDDD